MAVTKASDNDFDLQINSNDKVIVKFYADWCGTCRLLAPKFNRLSDEERFEDVVFLDVNAEESPNARRKSNVDSLPYFATYKNGALQESTATSKEEKIVEMLEKLH